MKTILRVIEAFAKLGAFGFLLFGLCLFVFAFGVFFGVAGRGFTQMQEWPAISAWLKDWQELVGAILGAVTTAGAAMLITVQIRADDDREEKRTREEIFRLAQIVNTEVYYCITQYIQRHICLSKMAEIAKKATDQNTGAILRKNFSTEDEKIFKYYEIQVNHYFVNWRRFINIEQKMHLFPTGISQEIIEFVEMIKTRKYDTVIDCHNFEAPTKIDSILGSTAEKIMYIMSEIIKTKGKIEGRDFRGKTDGNRNFSNDFIDTYNLFIQIDECFAGSTEIIDEHITETIIIN